MRSSFPTMVVCRLAVANALAFAFGAAGSVRAETPDSTTRFLVDAYEPAGLPGFDLLNVARSGVVGHLQPAFGIQLGYVHDALEVAADGAARQESGQLVANRARADFVLGLGLFDRLAVSLGLPFLMAQGGDDLAILNHAGSSVSGGALGDLRLQVRGQVFSVAGVGLGLGCEVAFPTGDAGAFMSTGAVRARPWLALDWTDADSGLAVVVNVGYHVVPKRYAQNLVLDDALQWGLALDLPTPIDEVHVLASLTGSASLNKDRTVGGTTAASRTNDDGRADPIALDAALTVHVSEVTLGFGGGAGLSRGVGAPEWRAFIDIAWRPRFGQTP